MKTQSIVISNLWTTLTAAMVLGLNSAQAGTFYWDSDDATPGFGSTAGTWGTSAFWSTDDTGSSAAANTTITTADNVNFGTATLNYGNATVTGPATAQGFLNMTFGAGQTTALTISTGYLDLAANSTITQNSAALMTVNSRLQGTGSLTKAGSGTLTLTRAETYGGGTTVNNGALILGSGCTLGSTTAITIASGATLTLGGTANNQIQNTFTRDSANAASLAINGTLAVGSAIHTMYPWTISMTNGTISFTNASGYLWMPNRTITFNGTNTIAGTSTSGINVGMGNVTFDTPTAVDNVTVSVPVTGLGVTKSGLGTLTLGGANSYTGATTINAGTLALTGRISSGASAFSMSDNTALNVTANVTIRALTTTGTMTVGTASGSNTLTFAGLSSTSLAPISVGALTMNRPVTVNIASVNPVVGKYPLILCTSATVNSLTLGSFPSGITANLVDDTAGSTKSIYLDVTAIAVPIALWTGSTSNAWDIDTTSNWTVGGSPSHYFEGYVTTFDNSTSNTTVRLATPVNPSSVTFDNDVSHNYSLGGNAGIAGATGLTKSGAGTLTITNANTYTGGTTVSSGSGTLLLGDGTPGNDGTPGTGGIVNDAVVTYNLAADQTPGYAISGTGTLTKSGAGTLTLSSAKSYTGGTIVDGGTLALAGSGGATGVIRGNLTIDSGGTVSTDTGSGQWALGYGSGTAVSTIAINGGTLNFATTQNSGTAATSITMTGGAITGQPWDWYLGLTTTPTLYTVATDTTAVISNNLRPRLGGAGTLTFNVAAGTVTGGATPGVDLLISGPLSYYLDAGAAIVKDGAGVMQLSANNTYTGATTILAGTLTLTGRITGGAGSFSMRDDTSLNVTAGGVNPAIATTGSMTVGTDQNNPSGMNTLTFAGLSSTSVAPISVGNLFLDSPVTVNITSVSPAVGHYPLIRYTGASAVYELSLGTLPVGVTATLVDDSASKSIYLDVTAVPVMTAHWTGATSSTWDIDTTNNWTVDGSPAHYREGYATTFGNATSNTTVSLSTPVNPAMVAFDNDAAHNYTLGGIAGIAGSSGLTKSGAGTLTLTNTNTYTGGTTIHSGSGTIQLGDGTPGNDGTPGTGGILNDAAVGFNLAGNQTPGYAIAGTGTLAKSGGGTLTFTSANTYTGGTTVNGGTLALAWPSSGGGNGLIRGNLTINSGATVAVGGYQWALGYLAGGLSVSHITLTGGTLDFTGATQGDDGTSAQTITMTGGAITGQPWDWYSGQTSTPTLFSLATDTTAVISSSMMNRVGGGGTITLDVAAGTVTGGATPGVDLLISGALVDSFAGGGGGTFAKTGTGHLLLTGSNTYSGPTTINQGVVTLGGSGTLSSTSSITIASGATLNLDSTTWNQFQINRNGTGTLVINGTLAVTQATANTMYPNTITLNNGTLTSTNGAGDVLGAYWIAVDRTITANGGSNTISGNGNIGIQNGVNLTVDTPLDTDAATVSTVLQHQGGLAKAGLGTVTLSAANTYTGNTTVNAGTLVLADTTGQLAFTIGANAVNNKITGAGAATLNGKFSLNLISADPVTGNSWTLVDRNTLTGESFGASFSLVGFAEAQDGVHTCDDGTHTWTFTEADGKLTVAANSQPGYADWAATNAPTGTSADDYDNDGVSNGAEWVLGGTKDRNDLDKLPKVTTPDGDVVFTFLRDQNSKTPDTTLNIQVGTTLESWPDVYAVPNDPVTNNPGVTVVDNLAGFDIITMRIPRSSAARKFARLQVVVP